MPEPVIQQNPAERALHPWTKDSAVAARADLVPSTNDMMTHVSPCAEKQA